MIGRQHRIAGIGQRLGQGARLLGAAAKAVAEQDQRHVMMMAGKILRQRATQVAAAHIDHPNIAAATELSRKQVASVLDSLSMQIKAAVGKKGPGIFAVPGLMKIIVDAQNDRILGAAILGSEGGETVQILGAMILADAPYTVLKGAVYIHPTLAEGFFGLMESVKPAN